MGSFTGVNNGAQSLRAIVQAAHFLTPSALVILEEIPADHGGVRAQFIAERPAGRAAAPRVVHALDRVLLRDDGAVVQIRVDGVAAAIRHCLAHDAVGTVAHAVIVEAIVANIAGLQELLDGLLAVDRVDDDVGRAVEYHRRHQPARRTGAAPRILAAYFRIERTAVEQRIGGRDAGRWRPCTCRPNAPSRRRTRPSNRRP